MNDSATQIQPELDLLLERVTDVPADFIWAAWTQPELIKRWFTPAPWTTTHCEIDLRPGGIFSTVMRSPEGGVIENIGCVLEVVPNQRLVWTGALGPGFRPRPASEQIPFLFTAVIELKPRNGKTDYTVAVLHGDAVSRNKHEAMRFHHGWGAAFDQLVSMYKPE